MSEPSETSGRPLASTTKHSQQSRGSFFDQPTSTHSQQPSLTQTSGQPPPGSRTSNFRRVKTSQQLSSNTDTSSSRPERQPASPTNMMSQLPSVQYTRTGRISKAKKGLKVHNCENCGRSYSRAEHLRRHKKNHAQDDAIVCDFPDCGKTFYRLDLLHRHQERHNETEKETRQQSVFSHEGSPEVSQGSLPGLVSSSIASATLATTRAYYTPQPVSPIHEPVTLPSSTKQRSSYSARQSMSVPVPIDAMTPSLSWSEPYSQSPGYSSSSGYASPIPGPGDYTTMYAGASYGPSRTRASSSASCAEPWSYPSRSPASVASTMAYTWASSDKAPTASRLAYMGTVYPMTGIPMMTSMDPIAAYGHYGLKTIMQRDDEEAAILFGEQPYGMGLIAHNYPFEQYLDYFWRLFHPAFPVVHRSTFESMSSPPLLHAAMISVGGQFSNDPNAKRKSKLLHDRCTKLLDRRVQEQHLMKQPDRLCDYQAMFLIEVLSQYRARRAAKTLSSHFEKVYRKSAEDFRSITTQLVDTVLPLENATFEQWTEWVQLATWQRLLLSCYILESQQTLLLAREPCPSIIQATGLDLPFPVDSILWDATTLAEWITAPRRSSRLPKYIYEVNADLMMTPFDSFQSSVLLAVHYNCSEGSTLYASSSLSLDIEHLFDASATTSRKLLTVKLCHVTPVRALLAVSGESWILSEKVSSAQQFSTLKSTLRTWVDQLWSSTQNQAAAAPVKEALLLSVKILQKAMQEQQGSLPTEMGSEMDIYFAGLVLWTITTAARRHTRRAQQTSPMHRQYNVLQSSLATSGTPMPTSSSAVEPFTSQQAACVSRPLVGGPTMLAHARITMDTVTFLSRAQLSLGSRAFIDQLSRDLVRCQTGCHSTLLWIKMRLCGVSPEDTVTTWFPGPEGLGQLLDGMVRSLERILCRGWDGWGI